MMSVSARGTTMASAAAFGFSLKSPL